MVRRPSALRCVYCRAPATTRDHIPPKCLFAKNNRNDLIQVPSCRNCNGSFSQDDEYFLRILTMSDEVADFSDAAEGLNRVLRSLQRDDHAKTRAALERSIDFAADWRGGIFRGIKPTHHINNIRLCRTVSRTVKGIFWHETKKLLPSSHVVVTYLEESLESNMRTKTSIQTMASIQKLTKACEKGDSINIGNNAFEYSFNVDDPQGITYWITLFYQSFRFFSYTMPIDDIPENQRDIAF